MFFILYNYFYNRFFNTDNINYDLISLDDIILVPNNINKNIFDCDYDVYDIL